MDSRESFQRWLPSNTACFNIASSTTDEHIHFYLNYHTVGYLIMYYWFCLSNSLKCSNSSYFRHSQTFCHLNLFPLIYLILRGGQSAILYEHRYFADVVCAQTSTLHITKAKKVRS